MSCATALAAAFGVAHEDNAPGTGPATDTYSGDITATDDGIVIVGGVAYGPNTADTHGMHLETGTEVYAGNTGGSTSSFEHPTWAVGYDVGVPAGDYTSEVSWILGNGSNNGVALCQAFIPTLATAPAQETHAKFPGSTNGKVLLADPVTPGRAIVMVVTVRNGQYTTGSLFPTGGWTELANGLASHDGINGDSVGIYMRCVESGDGIQYGVSGSSSKSHSVTVMEWEIIAAPPPPPIIPEVEFSVDGVKFDNLLEAKVRFELNAPGAGYFVISKADPQAIPSMVYRHALVQCTFPEIHSGVLFEFFLDDGDFDVISGDEEGGEELRFGGPGTLTILRNAIVRSVEYLDGIGYPKPNKGVWVFDEGNTEGHIINKLIREAQAPARPAHPLAGVTKTFDADDDSNGQSWHDQELEGKWRVKIGANLYDAVLRLVNSGLLYIEMYPGLVLYARRTLGTDRTTGVFATGKVRFVRGENIADELNKGRAGQHFATHAEVKYVDNDDDIHYINATKDAGDFSYDKEIYVESEASHGNTARRQAKHAMKLREDMQDAIEFAHKVPWPGKVDGSPTGDDITGNADELNGWYLPGPAFADHGSYWLGDIVTLHTGVEDSDFEWQNRHERVYAITLAMDATGHLDTPIVELNSPHKKGGGKAPLQGISGTLSATGTGGGGGGGGGGFGGIPTIIDGAGYQPLAEKGDPDGYAGLDGDGHVPAIQLGAGSSGDGVLVLYDDGTWRPVGIGVAPVEVVDPATGTITIDYSVAPVWDLVLSGNVTLAAPTNVPASGLEVRLRINVYGDGTHTITSFNAVFEWSDTDGTPTATPPTLWTAVDSRSVLEAVSHDGGTTWGIAFLNGASTGGGGNVEVDEDGVSVVATATALDFRHGLDVTAPGGGVARVAVDEGELSHASLANLTTGDPHTQYALDSDVTSAVAAEASARAAADTALAAPDYLVGTATGTLSGEIVAGTTPGGELGGTWGSPTVDATHSGSAHVPLSSATPVADGGAGAAGSGTSSSKDDHKHPGELVAITVVIDGGGAVITTGIKGDVSVPFACTITGVRMLADQGGAIVVDIWKDVYASYPPVVGDSITASAKPTISATNDHSEDTTLTGWSTGKNIAAGDTLRFNVDSCTTITRVTLTLKATRD